MSVRGNQLQGRIPAQVAALPLESLDMGHNHFTGPIPPMLGLSPFLRNLRLDQNQLEGSIPPE